MAKSEQFLALLILKHTYISLRDHRTALTYYNKKKQFAATSRSPFTKSTLEIMLRSSLLFTTMRPSSLKSPLFFRFLSTELKLSYIPQKVKDEMAGLHAEDASRWNATTLAARFGAPRENVGMWLRLCKLRGHAPRRKKRNGEEEKAIKEMRMKAVAAWKALPELAERRRWVAKPSVIENAGTGKEKNVTEGTEEREKVEGDKDEKDILNVKEESQEEGEKRVLPKSRTAEWVESFCENAPRDVSRRTTFAFIEVAGKKGEEMERAVWLREGKSGVLRLARKEERDVLLSKARSQHASVWKL